MADDSTITNPVDIELLVGRVVAALLTSVPNTGAHKSIVNALADAKSTWLSVLYKASLTVAGKSGQTLHDVEEMAFPFIAAFVAPVVGALFGADVNAGQFAQRLSSGGSNAAARSLVDNFMKAVTGGADGPVAPGDAGSRRIASAAVGASLESTFNAVATEMISDLLPEIGPHFTALTALPESILRTLGVGRLVRQALRPIVNATCAVPATWDANTKYRPTLLGPGVIAKQVARGRMSQDDAAVLLARHGYSDADQEAIINDALKFLGLAELALLVAAGEWSDADAVQVLTDQGYDEPTALTALDVERLKVIRTFQTELATLALDAVGSGHVPAAQVDSYFSASTFSTQEQAQWRERAAAKLALTKKPLTPAEAEAAVLAGVLAMPDYRAALAADNRTLDAIDVLDLLLRAKLNNATSIAEHKVAAAADAAAAKKAKADAAAAKQTAHEAAVAQAQRGKPADITTAYIRGLVPIDRLRAVLAPLYDADTVNTLLATAEDKRAAYVQTQQKAAQAAARATQRGIPVATLATAVKNGVLGVGEYHARLVQLGIDASDADVMTASLQAELDKAAAAQTLHNQAIAAAKVKHIDLATLEVLVRRGHRTITDFTAALQSLGYDAAAVAALDEKLALEITADAAAAQVKARALAQLADKGLTLAQFERAVILGVKTIDQFSTYLVKTPIDPAAQLTIVQVVTAERAQAQAAQQRRAAATARQDARAVPLADLARAARLNVIPVAQYTADLQALGYSPAAIALETDLLTTEIASTVAGQQQHAGAATAAKAKGLSLAQLDALLQAGQLPLDHYLARLQDLGYSLDDAQLIATFVQDKAAVATTAAARAAQLASADPGQEVKRADFAKAVTDGLKTIDDYRAFLTEQQYGADDVDLYVALEQFTLDKAAAKAAGGP